MAITSVFNYVHNFAVVVALFGCFLILDLFCFGGLLSLLLWNKHWLFNSKGCSIEEYEQKHAFLTDCSTFLKKKKKKNSGFLVKCTGWDHWVEYKYRICLQIGVMSHLINFCHVKLARFSWTDSWCCGRDRMSFLTLSLIQLLGWVSITWIQVHLQYLP